MFEAVLAANAIWFGLAFHLFALRSKVFAKVLVPKAHRDTPVFDALAATGPFLGGFNLAFCVLSGLVLVFSGAFPQPEQRLILCAVFAIAHGSQFLANVPVALENRAGRGVWSVKGVMRFIFVTDCVLMAANLLLAIRFALIIL